MYGRVVFLYLEPKGGEAPPEFAFCKSCRMFVAEEGRCKILPVKVAEGDSCGLWVGAKPLTPSEAGLVREKVQCQRCEKFRPEAGSCRLYETLNEKLPTIFAVNPKVSPFGCCNAWEAKRDSH